MIRTRTLLLLLALIVGGCTSSPTAPAPAPGSDGILIFRLGRAADDQDLKNETCRWNGRLATGRIPSPLTMTGSTMVITVAKNPQAIGCFMIGVKVRR